MPSHLKILNIKLGVLSVRIFRVQRSQLHTLIKFSNGNQPINKLAPLSKRVQNNCLVPYTVIRNMKSTANEAAKNIKNNNFPSYMETSLKENNNQNMSSFSEKGFDNIKPSVLDIHEKKEDMAVPYDIKPWSPIQSEEYKNTQEFKENQNKMLSPTITELYNSYHGTTIGQNYEDVDDELKIQPAEIPTPTLLYPKVIGVSLDPKTVDSQQQSLSSHELDHSLVGVQNEINGTITVGHILTSGKINFVTKKPNILLDKDINYKLEPKGQYLAPLQSPRTFDASTEFQTWTEDKEVTQYVNQPHIYHAVIQAIADTPETEPVWRYHSDDEIFYHENGRNILEEEVD